MSNVYEQTFTLRAYEAGPDGAAHMASICNYLQEIAGDHAAHLGVSVGQFGERNLTWFLNRLVVEMDTYPRWPGAVRIETWPSGLDRLYAHRDFLLFDGAAPIGRATTTWLLVDLDTRRPVRPTDSITAINRPDRPRALEATGKLRPPDDVAGTQAAPVRFTELDVNDHVNNVAYVARLLDGLPSDWLRSHRLDRLDIQFKGESHGGDTIRCAHGPADPLAFRHLFTRADDDRDLAVAETRWSPLNPEPQS